MLHDPMRRLWFSAAWELLKRRQVRDAWEAFGHAIESVPPKRWNNGRYLAWDVQDKAWVGSEGNRA